MIIATSLRTESGDDYLFLFKDITNPDEYVHAIENQMRDELGWVYSHSINILDSSSKVQIAYGQCLQARIEQIQQLEDGFYD